jgi:integrase
MTEIVVSGAGEAVITVPTGAFARAVAGFLVRYPRRTRSAYLAALRRWAQWCADRGLDPACATRAHIDAWARTLSEEGGLSDRTISGYLTGVCGVYRHAFLDGIIASDPGAHARRPKCPRLSTTNGLTRDEARRVLDLAHEHEDPMVTALTCLLLLGGMRLGEVIGIDIEHLGTHDEWQTVFLPRRKGGGVATLSLSEVTARAVAAARGDRDSGPLLMGPRRMGRLDRQQAQRTIRRLAKAAGVTRRITPHSMRHTFVTLALDADVRERDIMASTGHSDPSMLVYYDRQRGGIERNATHRVTEWIGASP